MTTATFCQNCENEMGENEPKYALLLQDEDGEEFTIEVCEDCREG